ncbi:hypothetical protein DR950_06490 [Kitasatospora xanthocidica]|uniref:DUF6924 domain-containing protein n=1 Tax=Kitasatospora xanthocidica TaxID=83382 RepID=A0A372ZP43_9ACTN|nr:hypothetical protein [Kitasatospora xanthocidica]RGD57491.1 hypothetical protein DR950_06490 [Kitasatospora xanthocidica]
MTGLPIGYGGALVVRTDFSSPGSWALLCEALTTPNDQGFLPVVHLVGDPRLAGATCDEVRSLLPERYTHPLLVLADGPALASSEQPLVVVDLRERPGRFIRVVAARLWSIENNLSISNMDFDDFAGNVDADGVFRGF